MSENLAPNPATGLPLPSAITLMLDFDGVLHPFGAQDEACFVEATVLLLDGVVRRHPALEIVISSSWSWRYETDQLVKFLPRETGRRVVDVTPERVDNRYLPEALWSYPRHGQCWAWMDWHRPAGAPWIALDDDAWRFAPDCPQLLLLDPKTGFTGKDATELDSRLLALGSVVPSSSPRLNL